MKKIIKTSLGLVTIGAVAAIAIGSVVSCSSNSSCTSVTPKSSNSNAYSNPINSNNPISSSSNNNQSQSQPTVPNNSTNNPTSSNSGTNNQISSSSQAPSSNATNSTSSSITNSGTNTNNQDSNNSQKISKTESTPTKKQIKQVSNNSSPSSQQSNSTTSNKNNKSVVNQTPIKSDQTNKQPEVKTNSNSQQKQSVSSSNPENNNYKLAIEKYIENWAENANQDVIITSNSNQTNTTFTNFIQQNTQGVKILSSASDFSDIKVSFTKLPSVDTSVLGSLANDEWLTITATSNTTIYFTQWSNATGKWGTNETNNVQKGYIFTWTLPYNLNDIICKNGIIKLPINETALQLQNNTDGINDQTNSPTLVIPFGLAIGTTSDLTSVSSTWGSNVIAQYNGYISTNFGSGQDAFSLPNPWIVSSNNQNTSSNNSEQSSKQQTTPNQTPQPVIIPTITEKLNSLDKSKLLSQNNISSFSSYYNVYSSSSFKNNLINDLISTSNVSISNIAYNASEITLITLKNNTENNVILDLNNGATLLTLKPEQLVSIQVNILIINQNSFANLYTKNITLNISNKGADSYHDQMYCYDGYNVTYQAAIYGFLSTNITSKSAYVNYAFNDYGSQYANKITSSSWTTYYSSRYPQQRIQLSWMAEILGINTSGFEGYSIYIKNNSAVVVNEVDYNGTWYSVNETLELKENYQGFCLYYYWWSYLPNCAK